MLQTYSSTSESDANYFSPSKPVAPYLFPRASDTKELSQGPQKSPDSWFLLSVRALLPGYGSASSRHLAVRFKQPENLLKLIWDTLNYERLGAVLITFQRTWVLGDSGKVQQFELCLQPRQSLDVALINIDPISAHEAFFLS